MASTKINANQVAEKSFSNIFETTVTGSGTGVSQDSGKWVKITLTADYTITSFTTTGYNVIGTYDGTQVISVSLIVTQDGTGGWSLTLPSNVVWDENGAPTLNTTANTVTFLSFISYNDGTNWFGFIGGTGFAP